MSAAAGEEEQRGQTAQPLWNRVRIVGSAIAGKAQGAALPIGAGQSRAVRIAMLAGIWFAIQAVFALIMQSFELSVTFVEPIGALLAGTLLAQPLLRWRYRRA